MSIADFYLDFGIDGEDPNHMDDFLAAHAPSEASNSPPRGGGGGGGGVVGKRKRSDGGNAGGATACPACNKAFKSGDAMRKHLSCKKDAAHKTYREQNPRFGSYGAAKGRPKEKNPARDAAVPKVSSAAIRAQVEFYLSDEALVGRCCWSGMEKCKDFPVLREMARKEGQWVRLSLLAGFPKLKKLLPSQDVASIAASLEASTPLELSASQEDYRAASSVLELSPSRKKVRRTAPIGGNGMAAAFARNELVLLQEDVWVSATWKSDGEVHTEIEKAQQVWQLGCVPEDCPFDKGYAVVGAIDVRTKGGRHGVDSEYARGCRWGVACALLSIDAAHTAEKHTLAEVELAERRGATATLRALQGTSAGAGT